mmetsp:Transcript_13985/g.42649  ORF Transcript_13985/g.42649 Transcript_13985/m.42649 type:complete len:89 (+) Transcript_13985:168-434(+)
MWVCCVYVSSMMNISSFVLFSLALLVVVVLYREVLAACCVGAPLQPTKPSAPRPSLSRCRALGVFCLDQTIFTRHSHAGKGVVLCSGG